MANADGFRLISALSHFGQGTSSEDEKTSSSNSFPQEEQINSKIGMTLLLCSFPAKSTFEDLPLPSRFLPGNPARAQYGSLPAIRQDAFGGHYLRKRLRKPPLFSFVLLARIFMMCSSRAASMLWALIERTFSKCCMAWASKPLVFKTWAR